MDKFERLVLMHDMSAPMSDREQNGLRGSVKICGEEMTHPGGTDAEGNQIHEPKAEHEKEYDVEARIKAVRFPEF